ncbi:Morn repeat domain containing protein [Pandoravirus neocaledonia]|uniref:Morn repeat domain containing protein n=1 Tax=Pandoravirus neocaledonia TaxID=2107708 RepID=A0A2U7UDU8_9VIRU|nr:Morn repeat domain containing protein [Pandoravirus neocaledonia]AVK76596.1 Morn repeat domain containing protein [Pandoravirus neocaledonia]
MARNHKDNNCKRKIGDVDDNDRAIGSEITDRVDQGADQAKACQSTIKRQRYGIASPFSLLPNETILAILAAANQARTLGAWSLTCKRHRALALDASLWRRLCETHFDPLLHRRFAAYNKSWHWLYRAQAARAPSRGRGVGAVPFKMRGDNAPWVYWGDTLDGHAEGYGVAVPQGSTHYAPGALVRTKAVAPPTVYHEGGFSMGMCHGWSRRVDKSGASYVGGWCMKGREGRGIHVYPCGKRYEGQFKCNVPHGSGTCTWPTGTKYRGRYEHGLRHGHGEATLTNGDRYVGAWVCGQRDGFGIEMRLDGTCFVGMWKEDVMCGYGIRVDRTGKRLYGQWDYGQVVNPVLRTHPDGLRYVGGWAHDRGSKGYGSCLYPDGSRLTGLWSGAMCVRGRVVSHRPYGPPCEPDVPCAACEAIARGANQAS